MMDLFVGLKIAHGVAMTLLLIILITQTVILYRGKEDVSTLASRKKIVIVQHSTFFLLILTGTFLLYLKGFNVQHWFYAKAVLFLVIISASTKAFKKGDGSILPVQRKGGIVIAWVAFFSIIGLVITKPAFF
ncbi:SirB2 family protein [Acinetobacter apis]|uniref:Invasion gene expression up-regulator, SirB n=1 Tax=Acinetobacter apis TaxID=1229165 RepID=A0A217EGB7_9GAMM|nr:SirB2 family protein [Acinetobacter apis]SNQ29525.1 Invasion gene expression up-regulator, SirB [Acinetobacter apis]